jgi:plasmid stabilization system protein ParE
MASDKAAVIVNTGLRRSSRNPYRTSCHAVSNTEASYEWFRINTVFRRKKLTCNSSHLAVHNLPHNRAEVSMPQGDKSAYTDKQKRQAEHIEEGYEERGLPEDEAERRAWATVNAMDHGGKKSGSGRGKSVNKAPARKGGRKGGRAAARTRTSALKTSSRKTSRTSGRKTSGRKTSGGTSKKR